MHKVVGHPAEIGQSVCMCRCQQFPRENTGLKHKQFPIHDFIHFFVETERIGSTCCSSQKVVFPSVRVGVCLLSLEGGASKMLLKALGVKPRKYSEHEQRLG